MTTRKKSHLLLSDKRMNGYLLDVGLCKQKKIVGGDYSVFRAYEARNLIFNFFRWIDIRKENDTRETTWINDARGFGSYYQV